MLPIIADISIKKNIRPDRPMVVSSMAAQMAITASPVSVATVTVVSIIANNTEKTWSIPQIRVVSIPASLCGVLLAALWSMRRGKDLDDDAEFQERMKDPAFRANVESGSESLIGKAFPREAYVVTWIFLGALILMLCKVDTPKIASTTVFKSGATAMFSIFGVAWMTETVVHAHLERLEGSLEGILSSYVWAYAIVLFIIGKLANSQAAGLLVVAPMALKLGVNPVVVVGFIGASYGYFILPTYPSDLAAIGFDPTGTTRIGKYIVNHSFLVPGLICVFTSCLVGTLLALLVLA